MIRPGILLLSASLALSGCQPVEPPVTLTSQNLEFAGAEEYGALFDSCVETLRRYGFDLDRVDRLAGVITTFPETSEHFFEFWRRDVDTRYDWVEASLIPVRRKVSVEVQRPAGELAATLVVTVFRERLSTPDRQYNTSGAAFLVFGEALPATTGRPVDPYRDEYWIADGRDGAMEARLIWEMTGLSPRTNVPAESPPEPE